MANLLMIDIQINKLTKMQVELLSAGISAEDYNIISNKIGDLKDFIVNCDSYVESILSNEKSGKNNRT